ncbi:MAG: type II toxin-antitoxin system prevent-host-death family antitoxin [candidate division Zixibacteria bacterium]|nr:type II toxin-antitoxin system prevent-host-death family antitoxin [candidate division Zixibacteria bacterium]
MHTIRIGIREARAHLSKLLKRVQQGYSVIITDRSKPIAKIIPADISLLPLKDRLKALENQGWIETAPGGKRYKLPPPLPTPQDFRVQDLLREDRNR